MVLSAFSLAIPKPPLPLPILWIFPKNSLREKSPYSEFFWYVISRIWIEYGEILRISACSVRIQENTDQTSPEYGHFSGNDCVLTKIIMEKKERLWPHDRDLLEAHTELSLKCKIELFKISRYIIPKKVQTYMFHWVLNTPLFALQKW